VSKFKTGTAIAVALVIGVGIGTSGQSKADTVTHVKTVQGPTKVVYRTKTKYRTPQGCITALNGLKQAALAENSTVLPMMKAAWFHDTAGVTAQTDKIKQAAATVRSISVPYAACVAAR
jgi:hypothetical protein